MCVSSGDSLWRECRSSVGQSSSDDPKQRSALQTGHSSEFTLLYSSQNTVNSQTHTDEASPRVCVHISNPVMFLRHESLKLGKNFAKMSNCSLWDIVCLLSLSPEAVLTAQIKSSKNINTCCSEEQHQQMSCVSPGSKLVNPFRFLEVFEIWGPYLDGELIQEQSVTAFQKGHWQKEKKVLLGTTQNFEEQC